ncbi:hypothetical protein [Pedobacter sp. Hv1]|uniref:hypothetical protein n=1 Tax=Pedobacter sp. Hv1 TaxID=1740090 RepID=UPI0006D8B225|nr:hypothetical protein [Pedobacter sp. Hv1]KQC00240.1 hypothetical protein AQF98_12105 [Pedobacter sp. Hv1]
MELSSIEKEEIGAYIFTIGKYIETYNEVYDHVLNTLVELPGAYHLNLVQQIIEVDFGGTAAIRKQENIYQKQIKRRYLKLMGLEMLYTFKLRHILPNLILLLLCYVLYVNNTNLSVLFKTIYLAICVLIVLAGVFCIIYRYIIHRKTKKDSIKSELIFGLLFLPIGFINILFNVVITKENTSIAVNTQHIILLALFFVISIYIRAFMKLYTERITVLAI